MKPVFISYSRKDVGIVGKVAETLTTGGIRIWQDIDDLAAGSTEPQIEKAIREECSGFLICITENSAKSGFVCQVELKKAYDRHISNPDFPIIPLFLMDVKEANRCLSGIIPNEISSFNGVIFKDCSGIEDAARKTRQILLKHLLKPMCGLTSRIALSTWQPTSKALDVHLDLDWSRIFLSAPSPLFRQDTWSGAILPALWDLKCALSRAGVSRIQVHPVANLSAGLAFGFVFRKEARFALDVIQKEGICWSSDIERAKDCSMVCRPPQTGEISSSKIALVISLTQNAKNQFTKFRNDSGIQFRAIIFCEPVKGAWPVHIPDGSIVKAIADEVRNAVVNARSQYGCNELHVFASIPIGLAVLIGHELNACGLIQLYEHNKTTDEYAPSWTLREEIVC